MPLNTGPSVTCSEPFSSDIDSSSGASSSSFSVKPSLDSGYDISSIAPPSFSPVSSAHTRSSSDEQGDAPQQGKNNCKSHIHRHRHRKIFLSMGAQLNGIRYVWEVMLFCLLCFSVTYNK